MYEESLTGLITHDSPCVLIGLSDAQMMSQVKNSMYILIIFNEFHLAVHDMYRYSDNKWRMYGYERQSVACGLSLLLCPYQYTGITAKWNLFVN